MAVPIIMAKVNGATQVSQLIAASGSETFTVGKIATVAGGGGIVSLTPSAGGTAIAVQLENARQATELSTIVGKTVTVGKPSMLAGVGAGNNWLMFQPMKAGAAKASVSTATMLKLEGANQGIQAAALTGKEFTVVQPLMTGNQTASTFFLQPTGGGNLISLKMAHAAPAASSMVGKTVVIGQTPIVSGGAQGTWLAMKPAAGATISKVAGGTVAAKAAGAAASKTAGGTVVAKAAGAAVSKSAGGTVAASTVAPSVAKTAVAAMTVNVTGAGAMGVGAAAGAAGGAILHTSGLTLALGIIGGLGPVILVGAGVGAAYGFWRKHQKSHETDESH